jgi:hypothetical protein
MWLNEDSSTPVVNRMVQSEEETSSNRCEGGGTLFTPYADQLVSPQVWKMDSSPK